LERGKLYGVGVGPGDPELITLKAVRIIEESDMIAVPGEEPKNSMAYKIAREGCRNLEKKEVIAIPMPMTKEEGRLRESHKKGADVLAGILDQGKQAAFLTLGDPAVYSTYLYLHKILISRGYEAEMVSGVPSFCAGAAALNTGLVEKGESLHVIPASYSIEDALKLSGTKVLMKSGKKLKQVKQWLLQQKARAVMVENCGMEGEKHYESPEEIPEEGSYYSLIIIKE